MAQNFSALSRENIARKMNVEPSEMEPLNQDELERIEQRLDGTNFSKSDIPSKEDMHMFSTIDFSNTSFEKPLLLSKRLFPASLSVADSVLFDNFSVAESIFLSAHFRRTSFKRHAYFRKTEFGTIGSIRNACEFIDCDFYQHADFSEGALLNADFSKTRFHTSAHFENTIFALGCPKFFEAELPENTLFPLKDGNWGLPFTRFDRRGDLEDFTDADITREAVKYTVLRKRMDAIQRPVESGFFLRKELSLRSNLKGWDALLIKLYGFVSSYGYSIQRPVIALLLTILLGVGVFGGYFAQGDPANVRSENPYQSGIGISISATFSFLGLGRLFYIETLQNLPSPIAFIYGIQTFSGFVFSFLLGLGVRNRLRLK
ncbi:hypothetical protein [Sulfitobacter pacificus]|uniref:hypothetical protein n=1 Tax=Sulfitobacter pacificus TaxID=1499314 RepID=UPI00333F23D2